VWHRIRAEQSFAFDGGVTDYVAYLAPDAAVCDTVLDRLR